jgi:hypothetical protein
MGCTQIRLFDFLGCPSGTLLVLVYLNGIHHSIPYTDTYTSGKFTPI